MSAGRRWASIPIGIAPNAAFLIGARVVQGIGGAMLTANSMAIITEVFPGDERGKAMGFNSDRNRAQCRLFDRRARRAGNWWRHAHSQLNGDHHRGLSR